MISVPPGFPLALLQEKVLAYLRRCTWRSPNPRQHSRLESYTPDRILVRSGADKLQQWNGIAMNVPVTPTEEFCELEVEGILIRIYDHETGVQCRLRDRLSFRGWVTWLPMDPQGETPLGKCEISGHMLAFKKMSEGPAPESMESTGPQAG